MQISKYPKLWYMSPATHALLLSLSLVNILYSIVLFPVEATAVQYCTITQLFTVNKQGSHWKMQRMRLMGNYSLNFLKIFNFYTWMLKLNTSMCSFFHLIFDIYPVSLLPLHCKGSGLTQWRWAHVQSVLFSGTQCNRVIICEDNSVASSPHLAQSSVERVSSVSNENIFEKIGFT